MSTQNSQPAASAAPSVIEAMHAQWEISYEAYHINDGTRSNTPAERHRRDEAMAAAAAEEQHLQSAILYQVPASPRDAAILQLHIQSRVDTCAPTCLKEQDHQALVAATGALLVYMAGRDIAEGSAGPTFQRTLDFHRTGTYFRTARRGA